MLCSPCGCWWAGVSLCLCSRAAQVLRLRGFLLQYCKLNLVQLCRIKMKCNCATLSSVFAYCTGMLALLRCPFMLMRSHKSTLCSSFCVPLNPACSYCLIPPPTTRSSIPCIFMLTIPPCRPIRRQIWWQQLSFGGRSRWVLCSVGNRSAGCCFLFFFLINGHRSNGRTRSPRRQWDIKTLVQLMRSLWSLFEPCLPEGSVVASRDVGETDSELHC